MKTKVFKLVTLCLLCIALFSMPVFASEEDELDALMPISVESKLLPPDVKFSRVVTRSSTARGKYFSDMILEISNPEPGVIGVAAGVTCGMRVDRIYLKVCLDVKNGSGFTQVKSWTYDTENVVVSSNYEEYTGAKAGQYYRMRASYIVYMNGERETGSSHTDALQVD